MKEMLYRLVKVPEDGSLRWLYPVASWSLLLWMFFLGATSFLFPVGLYRDPMVWIATLVKVLIAGFGVWGLRVLFLQKTATVAFYERWRQFTGYGIVITYVSGILPQVVREFNSPGVAVGGLGFILFVVLTTLFPVIHYLALSMDSTRKLTGVYSLSDVESRRAIKKNRARRMEVRRATRKRRNLIQNLWCEWIEPILGAILWVLVINHFLFQLYQIPSESMVPTFLKKDRVIALKSPYGPSIPLTNHRLPTLLKPKVGEIVTFVTPELDSPDSTLRYKSVFSRIFQPFIYIITLTRLDIDSNEDGSPKARQLVKRVVAGPGEKVAMLNDKLYKRKPNEGWRLMSELPGSREYGYANLIYSENPDMAHQRINPTIRKYLDQAISIIDDYTPTVLEDELNREREQFILNISLRGSAITAREIGSIVRRISREVEEIKGQLAYYLNYVGWINTLSATEVEKQDLLARYEESIAVYPAVVLRGVLGNLTEVVEAELETPGYIERELNTSISIAEGSSPYREFMIRANGVMKLYQLRLCNWILSLNSPDLSDALLTRWRALDDYMESMSLSDLTSLSIYINGIELPSSGVGRTRYYSYFDVMQFPEYPRGGDYLAEGEYFLMGDNRYNSVDSRMGSTKSEQWLDPEDRGVFASSVMVSWAPHAISQKYLHGRVLAILFPPNRLKLF